MLNNHVDSNRVQRDPNQEKKTLAQCNENRMLNIQCKFCWNCVRKSSCFFLQNSRSALSFCVIRCTRSTVSLACCWISCTRFCRAGSPRPMCWMLKNHLLTVSWYDVTSTNGSTTGSNNALTSSVFTRYDMSEIHKCRVRAH